MAEPLSQSNTFSALAQRVTTLENNGAPVNGAGIVTALGYTPANKAGDDFTGHAGASTYLVAPTIFAQISGNGYVAVAQSGDTSRTGYIGFYEHNDVRLAYVGASPNGGSLQYVSDSGAGHYFTGGPVAVNASLTVGDANCGMAVNAGNPVLSLDSGDYFSYNRAADLLAFAIGGASQLIIDSNAVGVVKTFTVGDNDFNMMLAGGVSSISFDSSDCAIHYTRGGSAGFYTFTIAGDQRLAITNAYTFASTAMFAGDTNFGLDGAALAVPKLRFDSGSDNIAYTRATNTMDFNIGGASKMHVNAAGVTTSALTVDSANGLLVTNGGSGKGQVVVAPGDATYTGSIALLDPTGTQVAGIGPMTTTGVFGFIANNGLGFNFFGGPTSFQDLNFALDNNSGSPRVQFDTGDYLQYDRTANKLYFYVGGVAKASIDSSGNMKLAGTLTQSTTP